jgi:hypothetical protein
MGVGLAPGFVTTGNSWTRATTARATPATRTAATAASTTGPVGIALGVRARRVSATAGGPVALGLQL